jgi:hypothetical protein
VKRLRPVLLVILLGSLASVAPIGHPVAHAARAADTFAQNTITYISPGPTTTVTGQSGGVIAATNPKVEYQPIKDDLSPKRLINAAAIHAAALALTVPHPQSNPLSVGNAPLISGFNGLSHLDQRAAGTGIYANTQFSLEPPDQMLCAANGYVFEGVNNALTVYSTAGAILAGPEAFSQFYNLSPEINRATLIYGDFVSDPRCLYDSGTGRWFVSEVQLGVDPATGAYNGTSHLELAVSKTSDPTGAYTLYSIDTTDTSLGIPGCPCFGDQPLIGTDANGFYISTNEFGIPGVGSGFAGEHLYAASKFALAAGAASIPVVQFYNLTLAEGLAYSLQPAQSPGQQGGDQGQQGANQGQQGANQGQQGGDPNAAALNRDRRHGGTEYFLSSLDFTGTLDNRIAVWALTNTASLATATPNLGLSDRILYSETYGQPFPAVQKAGPTPLGTLVGESLETLNSNDDRMNQVYYAGGKLFGALNTIVATPSCAACVGIAYFVVAPDLDQGTLLGRITNQGYVAVNGENVMFPSIAVNSRGEGAMAFSLVGPDFYPSAAYTLFNQRRGAASVQVGGAGAAPEDGFTGYVAFGGNGVARWGDYSAAVAEPNGTIWGAAEYIPNAPRTQLANWGTYVMHIRP